MGWYSLYKWFIQFRKTHYTNMIYWYEKYLYDTWFNNLSDDEKQKEIERINKNKQKEKMKINQLISVLNGSIEYLNRVGRHRSEGMSYSDLYY